MCYNSHVLGRRVILDAFRAKESGTTNCDCTVTSDTPTKFNLSSYNNYHPGSGCGSTLLLIVNGEFISKNCHVDNMQLPFSNRSDTLVDIKINGPQSAISTDYCVLIESGTVWQFPQTLLKKTNPLIHTPFNPFFLYKGLCHLYASCFN